MPRKRASSLGYRQETGGGEDCLQAPIRWNDQQNSKWGAPSGISHPRWIKGSERTAKEASKLWKMKDGGGNGIWIWDIYGAGAKQCEKHFSTNQSRIVIGPRPNDTFHCSTFCTQSQK